MLRAVHFGRPLAISIRAFPSPTFIVGGACFTCGPASRAAELVSRKRSLRTILRPQTVSFSQRSLSERGCEASKVDKAEALQKDQEDLRAEAKALALKLYRIVTRSVRTIRYGNEHDEKEFAEREKKREEDMKKPKDSRLSMLSMLPPVDREDELRSRAEYYQQYARENFFQESDCFGNREWNRQHVARFLHHLRKGDEHRKWLLADMKFPDPFDKSFDHERVDDFERRAMDYVERARDFKMQIELSPEEYKLNRERQNADDDNNDDGNEDEDGWSTEEDDEDMGSDLPPWYRNPRSM